MRKRIIILLGIWNFLAVISVQAQDLHLSQFFETPLLRNPALAGIFEGDGVLRPPAAGSGRQVFILPGVAQSAGDGGETLG